MTNRSFNQMSSTEYTALSVSALADKKTDEVSEKIKEIELIDGEIQSLQIQIEKAIAILQQVHYLK